MLNSKIKIKNDSIFTKMKNRSITTKIRKNSIITKNIKKTFTKKRKNPITLFQFNKNKNK
jgi:hypothetical protein